MAKEICWRLCCPPVCLCCIPSFLERIVSNLAFFPPRSTYSFGAPKNTADNGTFTLKINDEPSTDNDTTESQLDATSTDYDTTESQLDATSTDNDTTESQLFDSIDLFTTQSTRGNRIACVYVRVLPTTRFTILYSHGNSCDLGQTCKYYHSLANMLECNIFSYDYSGYGMSTGRPSEKNIYSDIEAAWSSLQSRYGVYSESVILLGDSIGTVPTVHLASSANQKFAAVVLNAPLTSGKRLIFRQRKCSCCCCCCKDVFESINRVSQITSPLLVIHGTDDRVIGFAHGVALHKRCRNPLKPLWLKGAGHMFHTNQEYYDRLKYLIHVDLGPKTSQVLKSDSFKGHTTPKVVVSHL